jgi:glutaryl-CoA dehydrogenase
MAARTDVFVSPDYFQVDELLTEEQKLIRETVRNYVKKEISPIIEDYAQRAEFPEQIIKQLGDLPYRWNTGAAGWITSAMA